MVLLYQMHVILSLPIYFFRLNRCETNPFWLCLSAQPEGIVYCL